jgi:hypothetical protein
VAGQNRKHPELAGRHTRQRNAVQPRRTPLSRSIEPLMRGTTFGDAGAFRGIDDQTVAQLRGSDQIAAATIRRLLTARSLRSGVEEWCIWMVELAPSQVSRSPFLDERVRSVMRARKDDTPPWFPARIRQPEVPYFAFRNVLPAGCQYLAFGRYNPDIIADDTVVVLSSDDAMVTAAILSSRIFRVWAEIAGARRPNGDIPLGAQSVHNTFPCPPLSKRQQVAIEDAFEDVLTARRYADAASLDEMYRRELPRPLQKAHDDLDAAVGRVFGVKPSMTDADVADILMERYRTLTSSDAA